MLIKLQENLSSKPELAVLAVIVSIIAMLIIPMPTPLVDLLIGVNIVVSLLVLMGSFYVERILGFSSFPSVLLITTLFRLALSISTSRLILLDADAGHIVNTFGEYVIGDNIVVGFVIFAIVTVVQFVVITKGSERVAEVAARFSLDGMPGKQMSIDSDLRAGILDAEAAKDKRANLEKESQLYGSFDGAMKFVKGDAIAGIVIIFVNFIGGISVGMLQKGDSFVEALNTFTILTIGDGLVAQIPALLIAISAGFMVTRVNGEGRNLGHNIVSQLFNSRFALMVTAVLALLIGVLPGFPLLVFALIALALGLVVWWPARKKAKTGQGIMEESEGLVLGNEESETAVLDLDAQNTSAEAVPIILVISNELKSSWEQQNILKYMVNRFFLEYGIKLPQVLIRYAKDMPQDLVTVYLNEVKAAELRCVNGWLRVLNYQDELSVLNIPIQRFQEEGGGSVAWVGPQDVDRIEKMGYAVRLFRDELYLDISNLLVRNVHEFFGVQETKNLLDELEVKYPELLREIYRNASVLKISEVFQRLLSERVSIRNIKLILEALAKWGSKEKDVIILSEHIRTALARYISDKFSRKGKVRAFLLSSSIENMVRKGIRQTSSGALLNLDPREVEEVMDKFASGLLGLAYSYKDIVVLAPVDIRRYLKKLIEVKYPKLDVISFGEISDSVVVDVVKTI